MGDEPSPQIIAHAKLHFGAEFRRFDRDAGCFRLWVRGRTLVSHCVGRCELEDGHALQEAFDRCSVYGPVLAFHDWTLLTNYKPSVAMLLTKHGHDHSHEFERIRIAAHNFILRSAVATANFAYQGRVELVELGELMRLLRSSPQQ